MALAPGIEHALDPGLALEPARDRQRGLVLARDPEREGLQAAEEEIRRVRVEHAAEDVARLADEADQRRVADRDAGEEVVVPAEVLRARVEDEVGAVLERAVVHRRRERRVDEQLRAAMPL